MKAVVMAGGEGSRLRPLTSTRPKPLAPVANKPVMHHIVDLLRKHGVTEIVATLHYLADEIENYFGDGSDFGVRMRYVVEDSPLGTAGAVKMAEPYLKDERFFIISGDALTDIDLAAMDAYHVANGSAATIALKRVSNPLEFGVVVTDGRGRITRFLEKPSWGEVFSDTINTGIYILEPGIFDLMEIGRAYDFSQDLFPKMLYDGKPLYGSITTDYWTDIGNLQQYAEANYDALNGHVRIEMPGKQIARNIWIGEGTTVHPEAKIVGPACIGRNVTIEHDAIIEELTTIGDSTIVAPHAKLHRVTCWEDGYIGEHAELTDCTIADRNIIKDRVTVHEGVVMGRGCTIGSSSTINGNVKLWPDKTVASGAIVSMSLIYGVKWPGSLFGSDGVSGLANIEITPEFALKLGQAYGSVLKPGQTVMTSRDTHPAARIINRCVISGLLSVGINVLDLRAYPTPTARYAVRSQGNAGVHTRVSPRDPSNFLIEFINSDGINIDKGVRRKIENLFFREDFRRTAMENVGQLDFPVRLLEAYTNGFIGALGGSSTRRERKLRVVIDYVFGNAALILPRILGKLGVDSIALNAYFDESRETSFSSDRPRHLEQLANVTTSLRADCGILLDHDGESLTLVDEKGQVVENSALLGLLTLLVSRAQPGARIAVPLMAPSALEAVAAENGAEIIRTHSDRREVMSLAAQDEAAISVAFSSYQEVMFPEFQPAFDGLYAAAKTIDLLGRQDHALSALVDSLPKWHMASRRVQSPWERKGQIMRRLIDETNGAPMEMTEGLRVGRDGGWVLVLPSASDPTFDVYAEGATADQAQRYADELSEKITELVQN
jgi:mannose-1-phosphate guanylyltransferase/phosphomannomutase